MTTCKQVNIYRNNGVWAYALWIDGEFDHSDTLPDAETEAEARVEVTRQFHDASLRRVEDVIAQ